MKILLDESVPHVVKERLSHLAIRTVQDMGWTGIKKMKGNLGQDFGAMTNLRDSFNKLHSEYGLDLKL